MPEPPKYFSKARVGNITAAIAILANIGLWVKVVVDLTEGNLVLNVTDAGNIVLSPVTALILTVLGFMNGIAGFAAKHLWDTSSDTQ